MKLNDLMSKTLEDNLKNTDVTNIKPISDDEGKVIKIIVEYTPKDF